jgi:hypothetical protein
MAAPCLMASLGCEEVPSGTGGAGGAGGGAAEGVTIDVAVTSERTYVDLEVPAIVDEAGDWELAFSGKDVFTNGGVSGMRQGSAFGPLDAETFAEDRVPADVPFMIDDFFGGPFLDWWMYEPSEHVIYSRFHVFGVRRGSEYHKVQLISFYGESQGAPVAALYRFRTARVTSAGSDPTQIYDEFDGTAGGPDPNPDQPSGCLVLATGQRIELTPAEAAASTEWDLCFRRDSVAVNGGTGGPGGVMAVDLHQAESPSETLEEVMARTEQTELGRFDSVDLAAVSNPALDYRGDGINSAFTGFWIEAGSSPLRPSSYAFLVAGADGITPYMVRFEAFTGATADAVGTVTMRVKKIGGTLP